MPAGLPLAAASPATDRVDPLYASVRAIARFWLWFFFKAVDVRHPERVPPGGAVLLCINHPNNLIDSLLVAAVLRRKVHYMATASLFRNRLVARFLSGCGAIPVYRKIDAAPGDRSDRNLEAFDACHHTFDHGGLVAIYPEGTTHAETRVQRIKTGAARIALGHEVKAPGRLTIVPVGLSFETRKAFRGRVLVSFGEPVAVAPFVAGWHDDPAKAVDALTSAIQDAMEHEVVHVERIDTEAVARAVEDVYRAELERELREERGLSARQIDPFRLARAIVDAVEHFRTHDPARVERLWQLLQGYRSRLARHRLRDEAVRQRVERPPVRTRVTWSWRAIAGFPVFAYGAVVNLLPYVLPRWLAHRFARKETDYATIRLLASVVSLPVFWTLETWLVWRAAGPRWAIAFLLTLPIAGVIAYRYMVGAERVRQQLKVATLLLLHAEEGRRLLADRRAIVDELERAKRDYLAAAKGSSF